MHIRKFISRSISFLCVFVLLLSVMPTTHAAVSGSLTDSRIGYSTEDNPGTAQQSTSVADTEISWELNGTSINGTVIPGSTSKKSWGSTKYYPHKSAKSILTLKNNADQEMILTFNYTNSANTLISGHDSDDNGFVYAELGIGESVTVTLTTPSDPGNGSSSTYHTTKAVTTQITNLTLATTNADIKITVKSVPGGTFTVSDGSVTKSEGESFTGPRTSEYTLTAGAPDDNYHFDGWKFNGVMQSNRSATISGMVFKGDTVVEAVYTLDPLFSITTSADGTPKDELVTINSRFEHQATNEKKDTKVSANNTVPYYTVTDTSAETMYDTYYVPSLEWAESDSTIVVSGSGSATGEYEGSGSRSWAYANMVSDMICIYAKEDCVISFDYNNSLSLDSDALLKDNTATPGLHLYESGSGTEKITTVLSKGITHSEASGNINHTLAKGKYLYVYTNGWYKGGKMMLSSGYVKITYSFSSTISNVSVKANDTKYTQTTTFKDNAGNVLKGGKLTLNGTSYTSGDDGKISVAALPGGQAMQLTSVTAPTNYVFLGWEVNGVMHCTPTYEYTLDADTVVNPIFVPKHVTYDKGNNKYQYKNISGTMVDLNGQYIARNGAYTEFYTSLAEAFEKTDETEEVVLLGNLTIEGDFAIDANEVLIVPSFMNDVFNKDESGTYVPTTSPVGSGAYATLTVNGNVTVNGTLIVSGQQTASTGGPGGSYGRMTVPAEKRVTVSGENTAFYGYGLVDGAGEIIAKNGAKVHELCEVRDIPHPMLMSDLVKGGAKNDKVMPFNSFYINTIEAKTTYEYGSSLYGHLSLSYDAVTQSSFPAIAPQNAILLVKEGGTVSKYYDTATGQITFRANEGSKVETGSFNAKMSVSLGGTVDADLVSGNFYLPMSAGYHFVVAGQLTINHDYKMLPGSRVTVLQDGELIIGENANLVFYRLNDYDYRRNGGDTSTGYGFSAYGYPINMSRHNTFNLSNIGSAKLHVDGTVTVNGGLYVTEAPIDEYTWVKENEDDVNQSYKNYAHYDKGYNNLTGTGRIDMSGQRDTAPIFKENLHISGSKSANTKSIAIVPIKGLPAGETVDDHTQYVSLTGKVKGTKVAEGVYTWGEDPCANGHTEEIDAAVGKTCTTDGKTEGKHCSVCGDILVAQEVIPAGHTPGADATCATAQECTVCHTQLAPATGAHSYTVVQEKVEATCGKDGYVIHKCETCDGTQRTTLTATGNHSYNSVVTAPTCTEKGYTTRTCTVCGDEVKDTEVAATGHDVKLNPEAGENGYTWAADNSKVTAYGKCSKCTYTETKEAATTSEETLKATCVAGGKITYTATFAADVKWATTQTKVVETEKDSTNHTYTSKVTPPTCGAQGFTTHTCSACGSSKKDTYVDATGKHDLVYQSDAEGHIASCKNCNYAGTKVTHSYGTEWTTETDSTCSQTGTKYQLCTVCAYKNEATIPTKEHTWVETDREEANCVDDGSVSYKCSACTATKTDVLEAGKCYYEVIHREEPTCCEDGYVTYACQGCMEGYDVTLPATGNHTYNRGYYYGVAEGHYPKCDECTDECNYKHYLASAFEPHVNNDNDEYCDLCEYEMGHTHDFTGAEYEHKDGKHWKVCTIEDCEVTSEKEDCTDEEPADHKCDVCEAELSTCKEKLIPTAQVNATCVDDGVKAYWTCSVCGSNYADNQAATKIDDLKTWKTGDGKIDQLGHELDEGVQTQAPTCTDKGILTKSCSRCDYEETSEIEATGHQNTVNVDAVAPTCSAVGYTAGVLCNGCGTYISGHEEVPIEPDAHSYGAPEITKQPTCLEAGSEKRVCKHNADHVDTKPITKLNHNMQFQIATGATCTDAGNEMYWYCDSCKIYYKDETGTTAYTDEDKWEIAALGHDFTEQIADADHLVSGSGANCQSVKQYYYDCSRCGAMDTTTWNSTETGSHNMDTEWTTKDGQHFHKCLVSGCTYVEDKTDCSYSYVNNYDGTHDYVCSGCGDVQKDNEAHDYGENHKCACGADETRTVYWKNEDGTVLETDENVKYTDEHKYNGAEPAKTATVEYTFTFDKWSEGVTDEAGNVTYTATFTATPKNYTVTWIVDGEEYKKDTFDFGAPLSQIAEPTKEGYTFSGWSELPATMPAQNVEVSGNFTVKNYTVTWIVDGEETKVTYAYGAAIVKPADPTKTGYTFKGWGVEIPATMPAENLTFTAQWTVKQYTITFVTDGGTAIDAITQDYGTTVTAPADPTKTGYTFAGWDKDIPATMPAEDVTITASWEINKYSVVFYDTDGTVLYTAENVEYGQVPEYKGDTTKKVNCTTYNVNLPELKAVDGTNLTYTVSWTEGQTVHQAYTNGFCDVCGDYEPADLVDGVYQIDKAGKLYWFAELVNSGNSTANAKLTANIEIPETKGQNAESMIPDWTPIGFGSAMPFNGTFDGAGHTISDLYVNRTEWYTGLIGYAGKDSVVTAVGLIDSYIKGTDRVGAIVGVTYGKVELCYNTGTIYGNSSVGGIVGSLGENANITNCYNTGSVTATNTGNSFVGGIVGYNNGLVSSCLNVGTVTGADYKGGVVGKYDMGKSSACYHLNTSPAEDDDFTHHGAASSVTTEDLAKGWVTWKLNNGSSEGVWKQKLGTDMYPTFVGEVVYRNQTGGCGTDDRYISYQYSNTYADPVVTHTYNLAQVKFSESGETYDILVECYYCSEGSITEVNQPSEWIESRSKAGDCETKRYDVYLAKGTITCDGTVLSYSQEKTVTGDYGAHDLRKVDGVAADCDTDGVIKHWHCDICDKDYADENATVGSVPMETTVIPATGHSYGDWSNSSNPGIGTEGETSHTCDKCHNTETLTSQLVKTEITGEQLPEDYETAEALKKAMLAAIQNTQAYLDAKAAAQKAEPPVVSELMDIVLQYKNAEGNWENATSKNFPADGVTVKLPVLEDTKLSTHTYFVAHLKADGSIEHLEVKESEDGEYIEFTAMSLSPILVAAMETDSCADGHAYTAEVAFSEDGTTYTVTVTCSVCKEGTTGHTVTSVTKDSTAGEVNPGNCQTNSSQTFTASGEYMGVDYSDSKTVEGQLGDHSWTEDIGYRVNQDDEGNITGYEFYATRTCGICNEEETATPTSSCEESQVATCVSNGIGTYTVTFDKEWAETQTYPNMSTPKDKDNHANVVEYPAVSPSCTAAGNEAWSKCADTNGEGCGEILVAYKEIPVTDHTAGEAVAEKVTAATCTDDGSHDEVVYCSVCKTHEISRTTVVDKALGHTAVTDEAVAPTFENTGLTEGSHCSVCNEVLVKQEVIAQLVAVAQIGEQKYQTLEEAIGAAQKGETIVLLASFAEAPAVEVDEEITVALNGNTITWIFANDNLRALKAIAADGFTVKANEDGTYTFVRATIAEPENGEAAIGNKVYTTLAEAIADANDGAFINLKSDVAVVPTGINKNLVIIPNGYKLAGAESDTALTLLQGKVAEGYAVRTNYGLFFINQQTNGSGIVAKIGEVGYYTVKEALEAAKNGDIVVMVADSDESQSDMIMVSGVKLDLGKFTLSVRSLVGAEGAFVYGDNYDSSNPYCKLIASNLILGTEAPKISGIQTIPIYSPELNCYVFAKYRTRTDYSETGLFLHKGTEDKTDDDENRIYFQFGQQMTTAVAMDMLKTGYTPSDSRFQVILQLRWNGETGTYVQNYTYRFDFVRSVASSNGGKNYTFTLEGYENIGLTEKYFDSLEVRAMIVTDSGVTVYSDPFTPENAKYN